MKTRFYHRLLELTLTFKTTDFQLGNNREVFSGKFTFLKEE